MLIFAESAEGGREIAKKTAQVGRITKIVGYIRIVFGLPYNYTKFITEDDLKAIRAKPFGWRNICCMTVRESRYRTRHVHLGPVHTNPFSNENGAVLLRIRLSSTLQRRKRSPKTEPFENALQSGAI